MTFTQWLRQTFGSQGQVARAARRGDSRRASRPRFVPRLDVMEDRLAPAVLTVNSIADSTIASDGLVTLREAISASVNRTTTDLGQTGDGTDTIQFSSAIDGQTIKLTSFVNDLSAGSVMPGPSAFRINNNTTLTLDGATGLTKGVTIARDATAAFRLFFITSGSDLTIQSLTLKDGLAKGGNGGWFFNSGAGGAAGLGGAIFNDGGLTIQNSTLTGNKAQGGAGANGQDGAQGSGGGGLGEDGQDLSTGLPENGADGGGPNGGAGGDILTGGGGNGAFGGGGGGGQSVSHLGINISRGGAAVAVSAVAAGVERVQPSSRGRMAGTADSAAAAAEREADLTSARRGSGDSAAATPSAGRAAAGRAWAGRSLTKGASSPLPTVPLPGIRPPAAPAAKMP
jgi:hypothetical protein